MLALKNVNYNPEQEQYLAQVRVFIWAFNVSNWLNTLKFLLGKPVETQGLGPDELQVIYNVHYFYVCLYVGFTWFLYKSFQEIKWINYMIILVTVRFLVAQYDIEGFRYTMDPGDFAYRCLNINSGVIMMYLFFAMYVRPPIYVTTFIAFSNVISNIIVTHDADFLSTSPIFPMVMSIITIFFTTFYAVLL